MLLKSIIFGTNKELKHSNHEGKMIDAIVHFAAYAYVGESVKNPLKYYKNNVNQSINLLDTIVVKSYFKKTFFRSNTYSIFKFMRNLWYSRSITNN